MVYVGTAGYSYKDWIGPFYPEGTKDSEMLSYYSRHFNFAEINSSYYHMPGSRLFDSINKKTPEHFRLAVKLYKGFTHERTSDKNEVDRFVYSLHPISESGKLLCLLAQFPYSFHLTKDNLEYVKRLRSWFPDTEMSVEIRNQEWVKKEIFDDLRSHSIGYVCVDEPDIRGLVKKVSAVTSKVSYLRMHGRNAEKWYSGEGSERYNYLYNDDELQEWMPKIGEMKKYSAVTVVSFNNHPIGSAVQNAKALLRMLQKSK